MPDWRGGVVPGGGGGSLWKTWLFGRSVPDWRGGVALVGVVTGAAGTDLCGRTGTWDPLPSFTAGKIHRQQLTSKKIIFYPLQYYKGTRRIDYIRTYVRVYINQS